MRWFAINFVSQYFAVLLTPIPTLRRRAVFVRWSVRKTANHRLSNMSQGLQPTPGMPLPKRNLLICFDAFGTLFSPKRPVAHQYAEVASSIGPRQFTEDEVQSSFKIAFKSELKQNPNYGKATHMTPETWWTNVGFYHVESRTSEPNGSRDG